MGHTKGTGGESKDDDKPFDESDIPKSYQIIVNIITELSELEQTIFNLRIDGLNYSQISEKLNIDSKTIKTIYDESKTYVTKKFYALQKTNLRGSILIRLLH